MKARQLRLLVGAAVVMTAFGGCKKTELPKEDSNPINEVITETPTPEPTVEATKVPDSEPVINESADVFNETTAGELARSFTEQALAGDFEGIHTALNDSLQSQYPAETLKSVYTTTVAPLGNYVEIKDVITQTVDSTIYVGCFLVYENNGLMITYGFNAERRLDTFYLNYQELPQEEQASDLYTESEITVGGTQYPLDGMLTVPAKETNPPIVILVHGSGQSDMDETVGAVSNKPFEDIAHGLAEQGIASIRYNKRYYQYSDQALETTTIYDEVLDDVASAIEFASKLENVDSSRIYVIGHSLGGMLAPKIAQDNNKVAGIVVMAGSARRLEDIIYDQNVESMEADDTMTEEERTKYLEMIQANVEEVKNITDDQLAIPMLGCTGYYWKSLNSIDTPAIVRNLKIPMLFLQGSEDFQVYPEIDFELWKELVGTSDNASFIEYQNLNHLFMPTTGVRDIRDYNVKANVDQQVITDIAEWIKKN